MPELKNLPADIYQLFDPDKDHVIDEDNLELFAENLKAVLRQRFLSRSATEPTLRFSSLGRPDRKAWFDAHPIEGGKEKLIPKTFLKFLYGDVIEQLLLFLTREAGHEVTNEQDEVVVDGVTGHIDAIIDGVVVDVKSASPQGYIKFERGTVVEEDTFGYVDQLAGYATVLTPGEDAAWLAIDKVHGDVCVSPLSKTVIKYHDPAERIQHLKEVISSDEIPPLCYDPVPDGKSGNMKLPTGCSYCDHKFRCHPQVRTFLYSNGPRYLVAVERTPDVPELVRGTD